MGGSMKKTGLFLVLALSAASWGQAAAPTPAQKGQRTNLNIGNSPTPADMYCSGYITADSVPTDHFVAAGLDRFEQNRYGALGGVVLLHGPNNKEGDRLGIVRHLRGGNHYES